jgi:adenylosuccinate synthase
MTVTVVLGAQWGDEGKGRVVDYLSSGARWVVRYQGGNNAGHTVMNDLGVFRLHLIPSGIFFPGVRCLLGAGMVVDLESLLEEIADLEAHGVSTANLFIDRRAHVVWPHHRQLDGAREGVSALGTTKQGIGPTYGDKGAYRGIRVGDLLHPGFLRQRMEAVLPLKNHELAFYDLPPVAMDDLLARADRWRGLLGSRIVDSAPLLHEAVERGQDILLEGQLGIMRDIDWGVYPYTTASSPTAGGACAGSGIPPRRIDSVIGVAKAYCTSVGGGPFPTELLDVTGDRLRQVGDEYGATTRRPRRCGWYDAVAVSYGAWINGYTGLAITKLDVLDGFETIQLCTGYRRGTEVLSQVPDTVVQGEVTPIYESWPGWGVSTGSVRDWQQLPTNARAYLRRIEELAGVPIRYVSVGPRREQMICL